MAGHMGDERVTVQNLKVLRVDPERNLLLVEGRSRATTGFVIVRREVEERGRERWNAVSSRGRRAG